MCRQLAGAAAHPAWLALSNRLPLPRVRIPAVAGLMICLSAALFAFPAQAFETRLRVPESGTFPPTGPLEVFIPADVPDDQLARLHMVIDGVDQRTRIEVRGEYARLTPVEPLTPGVHQLDLVELMPDGTVETHGSWEFTVAGEAGLSGSAVRYAGAASVTSDSTGVFLDNTGAPPVASNGSMDIQGRAEGSDWQVGARLPFVYDATSQTLSEKPFDIADYLLDIQRGPSLIRLGHHNIESHNLLLQNDFSRRGVSGRIEMDPMKGRLSAFTMQSSVTSGFDNLLGIHDRNDQVWGVAGQASPVDRGDFGMDVSFSYLDGRDPQLGPSTASLLPRREAQTWGMSTTFKFLQDTLSLRGDFAHSDFDIPGDPGVEPENGEAYKLTLDWSPVSPVTLFGDEAQFALSSGYERFSTFFTNPANVGDLRDVERYTTIAQLASGEWSVNAEYSQTYDNVDDSPLLPRTRARGAALNFNYTPAAEQDAEGNVAYGLLGNPTYGLAVGWTDTETVDPPRLGAPGLPTNFDNGQAQAQVSFDKGTWQWGLSYGAILTDDQVGGERSLTHSTGAQASINFTQLGLSLTPSVQYDRTNLDQGADNTAVIGNLSALYSPADVPVQAGLNFNFSRDAASDDSVETNTWMTSANVGWIAHDGSGDWPSLLLSLEGTHQYTDDKTAFGLSTESYVAFLKASLQWSRNFGTQ
ncbi:MAG: hypothetical protein ACOC91_00185 [bacterium]